MNFSDSDYSNFKVPAFLHEKLKSTWPNNNVYTHPLHFNTFFFLAVPRVAGRSSYLYDAPFILSDVICTGSEDSLIECDHGGYVNLTDCTGIAVAVCEGKEVM